MHTSPAQDTESKEVKFMEVRLNFGIRVQFSGTEQFIPVLFLLGDTDAKLVWENKKMYVCWIKVYKVYKTVVL